MKDSETRSLEAFLRVREFNVRRAHGQIPGGDFGQRLVHALDSGSIERMIPDLDVVRSSQAKFLDVSGDMSCCVSQRTRAGGN
jgi:hypothetical protein